MTPDKQPSETPTDTSYTAADVKSIAGLSYRQLNDWDSKGALPNSRENASGWRKFSARDVFALMVCAEIRKHFNVPLDTVKWVQSFMLKDGADHSRAAIELMAMGLTVHLLTDCKSTFIMDSDLEFQDLMDMGFFRGDQPTAFIFLKINPIVNRLLQAAKSTVQFQAHDAVYHQLAECRKRRTASGTDEVEILRLLRSGDYDRITIQLRDGSIISGEAEQDVGTLNRMLKAIETADFQTVTVKKHGGKIVRITRKIPLKFSGKKPTTASSRQREPEG